MLSRNISVQIIKTSRLFQILALQLNSFSNTQSVCLNFLPHVWSLCAKLAFFEEFPLSDLTSFCLFMLQNPQGNTYLVYMYACVGVGIAQRATNHQKLNSLTRFLVLDIFRSKPYKALLVTLARVSKGGEGRKQSKGFKNIGVCRCDKNFKVHDTFKNLYLKPSLKKSM